MAKSRCTEHKVGSSALRSPCGHALFENGSSEVRMLPFCGGDKAPVKTNSLEKPLCVCDRSIWPCAFKFMLPAQGRGEMNLPVEIASWLNVPQKACILSIL